MTAHERLTGPGVIVHLLPGCALARKAGVRFDCGHDPRKTTLQLPSRHPLQPKLASGQPDSFHLAETTPTKAVGRRLKSHR